MSTILITLGIVMVASTVFAFCAFSVGAKADYDTDEG